MAEAADAADAEAEAITYADPPDAFASSIALRLSSAIFLRSASSSYCDRADYSLSWRSLSAKAFSLA